MIKRCLRSIGRWFKYYWRDVLSTLGTIICVFVVFAFGFILCFTLARDEILYWENMTTAPEPGSCSLCEQGEGRKYHAPCIINLSTGEIAELSVYEPHPTEIGEVSTVLKTGFFSYSYAAGANKMQNQELEKCEATLPKDLEPINPTHFCYNCRRLLADTDKKGYVLVDLYDPDNITVYKIWDGAKYTIRGYLVTAHKNENRNFIVEIHGLLNLADANQEF